MPRNGRLARARGFAALRNVGSWPIASGDIVTARHRCQVTADMDRFSWRKRSVATDPDRPAILHRLTNETTRAHARVVRRWGRLRASRPSVRQLRAVDRGAAQDHLGDLARVGDVDEQVRIEHDEVGVLADLERAGIGHLEELGRVLGRRDDDLHRRHAGGRCRPRFVRGSLCRS
jgi:hypothetical protein